ncbi:hypothetical protein JW756_03380 [Candidatus Woesearchaeota archaeon]|nr:hypothetical protein [Candidatus Woesearchaeota archaeon]
MKHNDVLEQIGFSKSEAIVYLALLKLGRTKSGRIIKLTGLQSSVVHNALNTLTEKGFVKHILEGKIKHYLAAEPELIEKYIEAQRQEFHAVLPELKTLGITAILNPVFAEVYEGWKGLFTATLEMIEAGKSGEIYKFFAAEETLLSDEALKFFAKVDKLKKEKRIIVHGIAEKKSKGRLKDYKASSVRFTEQKIPPAMNIFGDKILMMSLSEKPVSILISSKEIAEQYHKMWDELWGKSK